MRIYVSVTAHIDKTGAVIPLSFEWEDEVIRIDRVMRARQGFPPQRRAGADSALTFWLMAA